MKAREATLLRSTHIHTYVYTRARSLICVLSLGGSFGQEYIYPEYLDKECDVAIMGAPLPAPPFLY